MLNPLDYSSDISAGIATIQTGATGTGTASRPLHIYIPPGSHTLTSPISIIRHYVMLEVDAGAIIMVPSGMSGLQLDGSLNPDGNIMHLVVRVNGRIEGMPGSVDGVYAKNMIHSDLFFNEIRWVGRDGIRFDGACFSNNVRVNRIHGSTGWNVNMVGTAFNSTLIEGEFQFSGGAGGIRLAKASGNTIRGIIENQQGASNVGLLLDSARDNRIMVWFEGNAGTDLKIQATDYASWNNWIEPSSVFNSTPSIANYNIDIVNGVFGVSRTHIGPINIYSSVRGLRISSGVTGTWLHETDIVAGAITDSSTAGETHYTRPLTATTTWDPGNLADGAGETSAAITVTGVVFGHRVEISAPYDLQGIICTGYVSAAGMVRIRLQNESGGAINLASGTWRVVARRD